MNLSILLCQEIHGGRGFRPVEEAAGDDEGGGVAEAAHVAGVRDQGGGDLVAGAEEVGDGVAVLFEQRCDLGVEVCDALLSASMSRASSRTMPAAMVSARPSPKRMRLSLRSSRWRSQRSVCASPTGSTCCQVERS